MRKLVLALLAASLLVVAGCSDGGGDDEASEPPSVSPENQISTETTIRALEPDEIDATRSPYCATWAEIRAAGGPETQGMDEAAAEARRREYYGGLVSKVEQLLAQAPEEVKPAVQVALDATRQTAERGLFDPFRTEEAKASAADLARYALDNCAKPGV